jgi:peptidoglycan hydrolase-like protein with peptidoglycan-binding domain
MTGFFYRRRKAIAASLLVTLIAVAAHADEVTMSVEEGLARLGYDTGPVDGEQTMKTSIAISKFQAENNLDVTGEVSPQLAGIIAAKASPSPAAATASAPSAQAAAGQPPAAADPAADAAALRAAQQKCLQDKVEAAQAAQKTKRGLGSLVRGVSRVASRLGGSELASDISRTASDVYTADATASDFASAAKDLGLTEDEVAACQNP